MGSLTMSSTDWGRTLASPSRELTADEETGFRDWVYTRYSRVAPGLDPNNFFERKLLDHMRAIFIGEYHPVA